MHQCAVTHRASVIYICFSLSESVHVWNVLAEPKGGITSKIKRAIKLKTSFAGLVLSFIARFILLVIAP